MTVKKNNQYHQHAHQRSREFETASGWRGRVVRYLFMMAPLIIVYRAVTLQVLPADEESMDFRFLQARGDRQAVHEITDQVHRGMVTDRNGKPLAVSTPLVSLWAVPAEVPTDEISHLATALEIDVKRLRWKLSSARGQQFVYLRRHLQPADASQIQQLGIPGVRTRVEYLRYYPDGEISMNVVGLTDIDDRGIEGVELQADDWLRGSPGKRRLLLDRTGRTIKELEHLQPQRQGSPLQLTIDQRIQYLAYRELKRAVMENSAVGGSIVVLNPNNGEVLAMVSQPSQNPNDRSSLNVDRIRNFAITDVFEPGSTVKPFAVIAALESGLYNIDSTIDTSPGYVRIGNKDIFDPFNRGILTLGQVIAYSSQVGISMIALTLPPESVISVMERVGIGHLTGIELPGERLGRLPYREHWYDIERASLSFGYGLSLTSLQLAKSYAVLAADGRRCTVTLLKRSDKKPLCEQVVAPDIAAQVVSMLEQTVANSRATGRRAAVWGYRVAGKTGTIRKYDPQQRGYSSEDHMALFVGMAPVEKPAVVAVVVIDEPRGQYQGGQVSAPVFSRLVSATLRLLNVPPDNLSAANRQRLAANSGSY